MLGICYHNCNEEFKGTFYYGFVVVVLVCSAKALSDHMSPHLGFPVKNEDFTKGSMIWGSIAGSRVTLKLLNLIKGNPLIYL